MTIISSSQTFSFIRALHIQGSLARLTEKDVFWKSQMPSITLQKAQKRKYWLSLPKADNKIIHMLWRQADVDKVDS